MDEVIKKVAALGFPGIVLVIVMGTTGLTGAAAITAALAFLGGPAGMLGGIGVLGVTVAITDALSKVGLENLLTDIYCHRRQTELHDSLLQELDRTPFFDGNLKDRLRATIINGCGCSPQVKGEVSDVCQQAIAILDAVPGMTTAHHRDFVNAKMLFRLRDGSELRTWKNSVGVDHVFLADPQGIMVYGGFVGWIHSGGLHRAIALIKRELT